MWDDEIYFYVKIISYVYAGKGMNNIRQKYETYHSNYCFFFFFLFDKEEVSDIKVKFICLSFVIFREIRIDKLYCNNHSFNVL